VSRLLKQLHERLEGAGLVPGSPSYDRALRREKVELCKLQKNVDSCWDCQYFDHCELVKAHLRDKYSVPQKPQWQPIHFDRAKHNLPEGRAQSMCGNADWHLDHPRITRDWSKTTCELCLKKKP